MYSLEQSLCHNDFVADPWSNIDKSETEKWEWTNDLWFWSTSLSFNKMPHSLLSGANKKGVL